MPKTPDDLPEAFQEINPVLDPRSEFDVTRRELERAERFHSLRPAGERMKDEETLEPLTDDLDEWRENKKTLDFPTVDTPGDFEVDF